MSGTDFMKTFVASMALLTGLLLLPAGQAAADGEQSAAEGAQKWTDNRFIHRFARVNGFRMHYVTMPNSKWRHRDPNEELVVLLHGWPTSSFQWRFIMPELNKQHLVIAPDMRGACDSGKPEGGYDKQTMAQDIRELVRQLGFKKVKLIGFDVGLWVSYSYAAQFRDEVSKLVLIDAMLPGTAPFEAIQCDPRAWHFDFHRAPRIPEILLVGKEREYITWFYDSLAVNRAGITPEAEDEYTRCYSQPGAMRASFELYRAFAKDVVDNREFFKQKLDLPVLALASPVVTGPFMGVMLGEAANNFRLEMVPNAGHWIAEENPQFALEAIQNYFRE